MSEDTAARLRVLFFRRWRRRRCTDILSGKVKADDFLFEFGSLLRNATCKDDNLVWVSVIVIKVYGLDEVARLVLKPPCSNVRG
mmetsp:Transcript_63522/g.138346  ORF Transcript_63522/g.138346 Transcript_63522/m.138346 type:complete len:84 (+) Transcript_63522:231-482(+)